MFSVRCGNPGTGAAGNQSKEYLRFKGSEDAHEAASAEEAEAVSFEEFFDEP